MPETYKKVNAIELWTGQVVDLNKIAGFSDIIIDNKEGYSYQRCIGFKIYLLSEKDNYIFVSILITPIKVYYDKENKKYEHATIDNFSMTDWIGFYDINHNLTIDILESREYIGFKTKRQELIDYWNDFGEIIKMV